MGKITKEQYKFALARVEELLPIVDDNTPVNDKRAVELSVMSDIVITYEKKHFQIKKPAVSKLLELSLEEKRETMIPISNEDYLSEIKQRDEAIKIALDTRKFEISMYWKRATYFWAFIASAFGGYSLIYSASPSVYEHGLDKDLCLVLVSSFGLLLSICFYFVNRGSKYWQENWEIQLDILLNGRVGPVFQRVKNPSDKFMNKNKKGFGLLEPYPFSVSKVNTLLSLIVVVVWIFICFSSLALFWEISFGIELRRVVCIIIIVITLLAIICLFKWSKGFAANSAGIYDEKQKLLKR